MPTSLLERFIPRIVHSGTSSASPTWRNSSTRPHRSKRRPNGSHVSPPRPSQSCPCRHCRRCPWAKLWAPTSRSDASSWGWRLHGAPAPPCTGIASGAWGKYGESTGAICAGVPQGMHAALAVMVFRSHDITCSRTSSQLLVDVGFARCVRLVAVSGTAASTIRCWTTSAACTTSWIETSSRCFHGRQAFERRIRDAALDATESPTPGVASQVVRIFFEDTFPTNPAEKAARDKALALHLENGGPPPPKYGHLSFCIIAAP